MTPETKNNLELLDHQDHQDLMETLDSERDEKISHMGENVCDCTVVVEGIKPEEVELVKDSRPKFIQETFELGTINFYETGKSLIGEPSKFLERVEAVQNVFFRDSEKTSVEVNAAKLKQFVELTDEIDKLYRQKTSSLRNSRLKDPSKFRESKQFQLEIQEKHRKQMYKDNFGYSRIIGHGYMNLDEFDVIYNADIRNTWSILSTVDESKQTRLDPAKIRRYMDSIDEYVIKRESTR